MTKVEIDRVSKRFASETALDDVSLSIEAGELFFLLGPSGCGKTTLLRSIAGLSQLTSGRILFDGQDVTHLPTERRDAVICFQNYALWPHMTVAENVSFGLQMRGVDRVQARHRVNEALHRVELDQVASKKPNALSGGQQQRVALARAMVVQPKVLLLDEPLSNLDAQLRIKMRGDIRRICKSANFTTIYVTHDQREALSVADRIALLRKGKLAQVGTPQQLYHQPASAFVAEFIGQTNLIAGKISQRSGELVRVSTSLGVLSAIAPSGEFPEKVTLSIRPEKIRLPRPGETAENRFDATVIESIFLGESSEQVVTAGNEQLRVFSSPPASNHGQAVSLVVNARDVVLLKE